LGGNRKGEFRTYFNLIFTMFLGGLWHGAAWSYAVWGLAHGIALAIERFFSGSKSNKRKGVIQTFFRGSFVFLYVTFAWLLFKLPNFNEAINYLKCIGTNFNKPTDYAGLVVFIIAYSIPVVVYHLIYLLKSQNKLTFLLKYEYTLYSILLFLIIVNRGSSGKFIYFQF
jgi:alginate O-acetyltransferase complex protein AlgI